MIDLGSLRRRTVRRGFRGGCPSPRSGRCLRITADRQLRGRKLLVLCLLFSLPILFAILAHRYQEPYHSADVESTLIFGLIPQALLPLAALIFASGMVQDDVEEQTLTYLLIRPIPRWLIYLVKLAGTWLVIAVLCVVLHRGRAGGGLLGNRRPDARRPGQSARPSSRASSRLSLLSYTAIFGLLGILLRRSLLLGVAYILVFEGIAANIDFVFRRIDGDVPRSHPERPLAGSLGRRLVHRSGNRAHRDDVLDDASGDQRRAGLAGGMVLQHPGIPASRLPRGRETERPRTN